MTRFVIDPGVALHLAETRAEVAAGHQVVAPTLIRSDVLALLYAQVRAGALARTEAVARLDYLRGLRMRLLGDRVLQSTAWAVAERLDWPDTRVAEYLALTRLQADAFVTLDAGLAEVATTVVPVAEVSALL